MSLISQEKETPPPQHESGPFLAGPPPLKDDREWIIVEGCSLSGSSPAATSAPLSRTLSDRQPLWDLIEVLADRPGSNLDLNTLFFSGNQDQGE